jgi:hypothetical protein
MGIIEFAILFILIVAVCAICVWFWRKSGIVIPAPFNIVLYAVLAILAILLLVYLARRAGAF